MTLTRSLLAAGLTTLSAAHAQATPRTAIDTAELRRLVDSLVTEQMSRQRIPGVAFTFVQSGRVMLSKGYGMADVSTGRRVDPDSTLFRIGSISKVFTATAAMQLVDRGMVSLDRDVNGYLSRVRVPATFAAPITLRHLLSHTAGLDEIRPGTQAPSEESVLTLDGFLAQRLVRVTPAGELPVYSTYGITLAGLLVEERSGRRFEQWLDEQLLAPLGMSRTAITLSPELRAQLAIGYELRAGALNAQPYEWYHTTPASSINSTAGDMARFILALLQRGRIGNQRILSERAVADMLDPHGRGHPQVPGFAFGFQEGDYAGIRVLEHAGGVAGMSSLLVLLPGHQAGFFIASQFEGNPLAGMLKEAILERFFLSGSATHPPQPSPNFAARADRFVGTYRWATYCRSCGVPAPTAGPQVTSRADGTIEFAGQRWSEVAPLLFRRIDGKRVLGFRENAAGEITHLFIDGAVTFERIR